MAKNSATKNQKKPIDPPLTDEQKARRALMQCGYVSSVELSADNVKALAGLVDNRGMITPGATAVKVGEIDSKMRADRQKAARQGAAK